jgi:hypothetical protein
MIFLLLLPFTSYFVMLFLIATHGEIISNSSGLDEWLMVMAVIGVVRVFMMGVTRFRQG